MIDALTLVAMHEKGAIVLNELVVRCLLMINPDDPAPVLDVLPMEILGRMLDFVGNHRPDRLVSSHDGPMPTLDQFEAAKRWIEAAPRKKSAASTGA